jgi:small neutral amino acid transporter SnatA (MarC family)
MKKKIVKMDARLWREPLLSLGGLVLFLMLGNWVFKGLPPWQAFLGTSVGWLLATGIQVIRDTRKIWSAERRRQAAAKHAQWVPLAWPQPAADPAVLSLPWVISFRPSWLCWLFMPFIVWGVILLCLLFWVARFGASAFPPLVPTLLLTLGLTVPVSIVVFLTWYRWMEVSEDGLTLRTLFARRCVRWQDARLFAVDVKAKLAANPPNEFELSSATTTLRWSRVLQQPRLSRLSSPFPEYARQMDALLAQICEKTGLPLYDLRDWESQKQPPPGYFPPPPVPQYPPPFSPEAPIQTSQTLDSYGSNGLV